MPESPSKYSSALVTFTIYSGGSKIDSTYRVSSIIVRKAFNKIPYAKIEIIDGEMPDKDFPISNKNDFKPGTEIKIDAGYESKEKTIFKGIVIKHAVKIDNENNSWLNVECRDKAIKMTVGRKNANYVNKKDSEIISAVVTGNAGLSADVKTTSVQHKEIVQYYSTDWDFILSRAELCGYLVNIEDAKLTIKPPETSAAAALKVVYGDDLMEFDAEVDARTQLSASKSRGWNLGTHQVNEKSGSAPTLNQQGDLTTAELAKVIGLKEYNLQTPVPIEQDNLKSWADAQLLKSGMARIQGRMKFQGNEAAKPSAIIELDGVGNRFKGNVFATGVFHEITEGAWTTEVEFGMSPEWFTEDYDVVAPSAAGLLPGVEGLHVGVVTKLDGDPDNEHKIQVKVPVMKNSTEGIYARMAKFYASNDFGSFFVPEIGDEVVLGYFNNDPCHPVILGSVYSSKNKPPYDVTADNFIKAIVTKTKMKIEFDEENKIITIVTPGKNTIIISDKDKSILLKDQNNNKAELCPDGIKLDSPKDISIKAKGKIDIDAMGKITMTSKQDVAVSGLNIKNEAQVGFTGKGNATAEVSASGQTTVKGAIVMIN